MLFLRVGNKLGKAMFVGLLMEVLKVVALGVSDFVEAGLRLGIWIVVIPDAFVVIIMPFDSAK